MDRTASITFRIQRPVSILNIYNIEIDQMRDRDVVLDVQIELFYFRQNIQKLSDFMSKSTNKSLMFKMIINAEHYSKIN